MRALAAILVVAAATGVAAQVGIMQGGMPTRDSNYKPPTGTAVLSGVVTSDDSSAQPIRRARVAVNSSDGMVSRTAITDDAGRYAFTSMPPSRYSLTVTKPGYVRTTFGARRFDRPGTPVTVADGQRVGNLDMKLARGGVITGRVMDETGQPAMGATVRVLQYRVVQGERTLGPPPTAASLSSESADDRGVYRLYGLPPGEYVVSASPRLTAGGEIRAMSDGEIRAAIQAAQQPGGRGMGATMGSATPGTTPPAAPPPTPREYTTVGYTPVYYPGTTFAGNAATVVLAPGEERSGVDFQMQLVRTAKIEGSVITPAGISPQSVQLTMVAGGPAAVPGILAATLLNRATVGPDGKFSYTSIAPGQYTISARATQRPPGSAEPAGRAGGAMEFVRVVGAGGGGGEVFVGGGGGGQGPVFWATVDVSVDGTNLSNVTLSLQPGMTVSGKVMFDGKRLAPPTDLSRTRVTMFPAQSAQGGTTFVSMGGMPMSTVDASGRFTLNGVTPGRYRFDGSAPMAVGTGWTVKSVVVKGRDVIDFPLEIGPGEEITDAVVTFTDVTQEVSGTLQDPTGRPAPDYTIVVFAADRRYWTSPLNRRIRTARPATDGRFTVPNLPAGEYRMAALTDIAPGDANDPAFLAELVAASFQFTLADGEKKVQDLRIR